MSAHTAVRAVTVGMSAHIAVRAVTVGMSAHIAVRAVTVGMSAHIAVRTVTVGMSAHIAVRTVTVGMSAHIAVRAVTVDMSAHMAVRAVTVGITYLLMPSLPVEHRPLTTLRHRTLFWAALVSPDQLVPCCFSSASVSRLQLLRGRPLILFPCGFQVRAWRVVLDAGFLRVCPIQPHFLHCICLATGSCPARSHRSSFRIFSCHWIL